MIVDRMYINGEWVEGESGARLDVENPATQEVFARIPAASGSQIDCAVVSAHNAMAEWAGRSPDARGAYLCRAADIAMEREEQIGAVMTQEQGKPLSEARGEVRKGAQILRYYAEEGKRAYGRLIPGHDVGTTSEVIYQPVGVAAAISPWNYPVELVAWKVGAALAAGCTMVVKPPVQTPLSPLRFVQCLADAGLPAGVVNVLTGRGNVVGPALIAHPLVKKVAFTGSTDVGRAVLQGCAQHMKKVSLELGGSCPLIVSSRCTLAEAVRGAVRRTFRNMGQICIAINRIYVHRDILDDFLDAFVAATGALTIGNGLTHPDADLGPMASAAGIEKTTQHIADAVGKGATLAHGGHRPSGSAYNKGYFFTPTILTDVTHEMLIMREETFGPAVGVMAYDTVDEAVELANATPYGLACYAYTNDLHEADEFARRLDAGNVAINNPDAGAINAPYGGFKHSGIGYEHGPEGLREYLRAKHVRTRYFNRSR